MGLVTYLLMFKAQLMTDSLEIACMNLHLSFAFNCYAMYYRRGCHDNILEYQDGGPFQYHSYKVKNVAK